MIQRIEGTVFHMRSRRGSSFRSKNCDFAVKEYTKILLDKYKQKTPNTPVLRIVVRARKLLAQSETEFEPKGFSNLVTS